MRHHPKAGQRVSIKNGSLKGLYFEVIDFLKAQYQGKEVKKIKADHLTAGMVKRGHVIDDDTVFGRLYPSMAYTCVHDKELKLAVVPEQKAEAPVQHVEEPLPSNVEQIKKNPRKKKSNDKETDPTAS